MMRREAVALSAAAVASLALMPSIGSVRAGGDPPRLYAVTSVSHYAPNIPNSGRIITLAVLPGAERQVLAASEFGGLFISGNGGTTWTHEDDMPSPYVQGIKILASRHIIVASTAQDFETAGGGGVYSRAYDGTFVRAINVFPAAGPNCPDRPSAHEISIAPDTSKIYVATDCGLAIGTPEVVFHHITIAGAPDQIVESVVALGRGHVIVGGPGMGVWYSRDDGAMWSRETTGIGGVADLHAFSADPHGGDRAYVVNDQTNLYQTSDGGQTWQQIPASPGSIVCGGVANVHAVMQSGIDMLYFGNRCTTQLAAIESDDHWSPWITLRTDHGDTRDLAFRTAANRPYLISSDGGVERSMDGLSFHFVGGPANGLDALQVTEVNGQYVPGRSNPDLYFGTQDNSVWSMVGNSTTPAAHIGGEGFFLGMPRVVTPSTHNKITYTTCGACVNGISNPRFVGGDSWHNAEPGVGSPRFVAPDNYVQAVDGNGGYTAGLQHTGNGGATWTQIANIPEPLFGLPQVTGLATNPRLIQPIYVGTRGDGIAQVQLVRVSNFGSGGMGTVRYAAMNNFGSLGVNPTMFAWYEVLGVDPADPGHIIAPDVFSNEVKVSFDGGDNWSVIPGLANLVSHDGTYQFSTAFGNRLLPNASVISFCPDNDSRVLIGTNEGGAYFSFDGGETFTPVSHSAMLTHATSVFWLNGCGSAYMSTYGRGIYRIDMTVRASVSPTGLCAPAICQYLAVTLSRLQKQHPVLGPIQGLLVTDGYITSIKQRLGMTLMSVTPGSIVMPYGKMPAHLKIVTAAASSAAPPYTQAAFFADGKLVCMLSGDAPLRLYPSSRVKIGQGLAASKVPTRAMIHVDGKVTINGNAYPLLAPDQPLVVRGFSMEPFDDPLQLRIDGHVVATFAPRTKTFAYTSGTGHWSLGYHSTVLVVAGRQEHRSIASTQFLTPPMDSGKEQDADLPPSPGTPTNSPTLMPSATPTATPSVAPGTTATSVPANNATATATATPSLALTAGPSATPITTLSVMPTATSSAAPTSTPTATASSTPTATAVPPAVSNVVANPEPVYYGQCDTALATTETVSAQVSPSLGTTSVTLHYR